MKARLFLLAALLGASLPALGQTWSSDDFYHRYRYEAANAEVKTKPVAVLYGDSITDGWAQKDPDFFTENNFVGRGISGEVTAQMLLRFRRDVVALQPRYVVILAGVNDIAQNNGYTTLEGAVGNIISMCEIALANGIKPVLCTSTPANRIPWRNDITDPADKVDQLNFMIQAYAKQKKLPLVDYWSPLADADRGFPASLASDGIHPTLEGYKRMEAILLGVLRKL